MSLSTLNYAKYGYRIVQNEQDLIANLDGSRLLFNNFDWSSVSEKTNVTECEIIIVYEDEPELNYHPGANNKITVNQVQRIGTVGCDSSQLAKRFNFMDVGRMYGIYIHGITSEFSLVHFEDIIPFASESLQLANCAIAKGPDDYKNFAENWCIESVTLQNCIIHAQTLHHLMRFEKTDIRITGSLILLHHDFYEKLVENNEIIGHADFEYENRTACIIVEHGYNVDLMTISAPEFAIITSGWQVVLRPVFMSGPHFKRIHEI